MNWSAVQPKYFTVRSFFFQVIHFLILPLTPFNILSFGLFLNLSVDC